MSRTEASGGGRVERKKEETKGKIINVALRLFKQQGFDATTMERIAEAVDIAKGTLYNYFPVKEAILNEFIQRSFHERNNERIEALRRAPDTRTRLILVLGELMRGVQAEREIFEKYLVYQIRNMIALHPDESEKSGIKLLATEIIQLGQKSTEIRNDLPLDLLMGLFEFAFIKIAQQFYLEPERFKADKAIEQCVDLIMNGAKY